MRRSLRILCALALCMMLVLSPVSAAAAGQEVEQNEPKDFVLVLDCTRSLGRNDPNLLIIDTFRNFIDKLPIAESRFAVIAFGQDARMLKEGSNYQFSEDAMQQIQALSKLSRFSPDDSFYIQELIPLVSLESSSLRDDYKETVERAVRTGVYAEKTQSPISHATAAAVDLLQKSGSADENACVILVTDGVEASVGGQQTGFALEHAAKTAKNHKWPMYCIQLSYDPYQDDQEKKEVQSLMSAIGQARHDDSVSVQSCSNPEEVFDSLTGIFQDFYGLEPIPPVVIQLPGTYAFTVPELASEVCIDIFGTDVTGVTLRGPKGEVYEIKGDREEENLIAVVEDTYYSMKMICPSEGEWVAEIDGTEHVEVKVSCSTIQERDLKMDAVPSTTASRLTKNDTIAVSAHLSYRGIKTVDTDFYRNHPASLHINSRNGLSTYPMEGTKDGYLLNLDLHSLPAGQFQMYAVLEYSGFRDGKRISNAEAFEIENLPLKAVDAGPQALQAYTNGTAVDAQGNALDLSRLFDNPDQDTLDYTLTCTDNRDETFECEATDGNYLVLHAGIREGQYNLQLAGKDPDMNEAVVYPHPIQLTIENRTPAVEKLPDMEVWTDKYNFQDDSAQCRELDLNGYFSDPDGVELTYTVTSMAEGIVAITVEEGILSIEPAGENEGETVLVITANDGVTTVTERVDARCISGIRVFWEENWIWFAIAAAILILLIVVIILLVKNKRVKGQWNISLNENGFLVELPPLDIAGFTMTGKKEKFLLKALLEEVLVFAPGGNPLQTALVKYFNAGTGADKITLVGVIRPKGCTVVNIPTNSQVTVSCNGVPARKKANVHGGTLLVNIETATGEHLTVTMTLN